MKTFALILSASAASLLLAACSKHEPTIHTDAPSTASTAATHVASPLDPLLNDVQKAKDVQKAVQDAAAKQAKAIKDAGG
ncbi:MAG: hypothetical protein L0H70_09295 [Xanthomonadales bacterium]|nr:hypothetical protein [Xanthomonadales bacterium]